MPHGPVDLLVVRFPGNDFSGEIITELKALVDAGTVRILDMIFVTKIGDDELNIIELTDLDDATAAAIDAFVGDIEAFFSDDDVRAMAAQMAPDSSAAFLLYENVWAVSFAEAVRNANGEVILAERIPRAVIEALEEEAAVS